MSYGLLPDAIPQVPSHFEGAFTCKTTATAPSPQTVSDGIAIPLKGHISSFHYSIANGKLGKLTLIFRSARNPFTRRRIMHRQMAALISLMVPIYRALPSGAAEHSVQNNYYGHPDRREALESDHFFRHEDSEWPQRTLNALTAILLPDPQYEDIDQNSLSYAGPNFKPVKSLRSHEYPPGWTFEVREDSNPFPWPTVNRVKIDMGPDINTAVLSFFFWHLPGVTVSPRARKKMADMQRDIAYCKRTFEQAESPQQDVGDEHAVA